ncbi:hypothetical protein Q5752_004227 [Cryptotrichosporon argae]
MSNETALEQAAAAYFGPIADVALGTQFANLVIDNVFAGILFVLTVTYWSQKHVDPIWTRLVVVFVVCMSAAVTIYYWVYLQTLFVQNFGQWGPWLNTKWTANVYVFDSLTTGACQVFFGWRAYRVNNRARWLLVLVGILLLGHFASAVALRDISIYKLDAQSFDINVIKPLFFSWLICMALADIVITVSMIYGFQRMRSGWQHTDKLILRLIRLVLEAQVVPACVAIAYVIEYGLQPVSYIGTVFQCLTSKAYAVGLLYSLTARDPALVGGSAGMPNTHVFSHTSHARGRPLEVAVQMETYVHDEALPTDYGSDDYPDKAPADPNHSRAHLNADAGTPPATMYAADRV